MTLIKTILLSPLIPTLAFGFPAKLLQTGTCNAAGNSCNIALTAKAINNLLVVVPCARRAAASTLTLSVSNTNSNTWSIAYNETDGGLGREGSQGFYSPVKSMTADTITCSRTGATNQLIACIAVEISGISSATNPSDSSRVTSQTNVTQAFSGGGAMKVPDYLSAVYCSTNTAAMTAGPGFTSQAQVTTNMSEMYEDAVSSGVVSNMQASGSGSARANVTMSYVGYQERINGIMRSSY